MITTQITMILGKNMNYYKGLLNFMEGYEKIWIDINWYENWSYENELNTLILFYKQHMIKKTS